MILYTRTYGLSIGLDEISGVFLKGNYDEFCTAAEKCERKRTYSAKRAFGA